MPSTIPQKTRAGWLRNALFLLLVLAGSTVAAYCWWLPYSPAKAPAHSPTAQTGPDLDRAVQSVDAALAGEWARQGLAPLPPAPSLTVARRLSLALTGTVPSLQEIRALEAQPESERTAWWLSHLFEDRRSSDYLAERLARAYVGVENGPFLVYRRRRLVDWLSDALQENRPYDQIVRALIDSNGTWTTRPEVNFLTATVEPKKGVDDVKLAARVTRAFLGVRIDCVQCHDGKLGSQWKQKDFHQLAAFFGPASVSLIGLHDDGKKGYEARYSGKKDPEAIPPMVPWQPDLLPGTGAPRERLAKWVTDPANRPFARAMVNRVWALLFNRPLVAPVDDLPLAGPFPAGLDLLADDFTAHGYDLRRLIRIVAATRVFQIDSRSPDPGHPVTEQAEQQWASFPMTRLRPEQMAGALIQASSLTTIDAETNVLYRLKTTVDEGNFVKRYGDSGEDEFGRQSSTIPQQLLLMNGATVRAYTASNRILNSFTRIGMLASDDANAVETAYLAMFTRRPTVEEASYFAEKLHTTTGKKRDAAMSDLSWTLLNSTEFAWNH